MLKYVKYGLNSIGVFSIIAIVVFGFLYIFTGVDPILAPNDDRWATLIAIAITSLVVRFVIMLAELDS